MNRARPVCYRCLTDAPPYVRRRNHSSRAELRDGPPAASRVPGAVDGADRIQPRILDARRRCRMADGNAGAGSRHGFAGPGRDTIAAVRLDDIAAFLVFVVLILSGRLYYNMSSHGLSLSSERHENLPILYVDAAIEIVLGRSFINDDAPLWMLICCPWDLCDCGPKLQTILGAWAPK